MKATPPRTPPTIAPIGFEDGAVWPGIDPRLMHTVEAHSVHDSAFKEQVSPAPHDGQLGVPGGHWTQRRKIVRRVPSTSAYGVSVRGQSY